MTNEQLVIRIKAGDEVKENMLQLWQQNQGFIYSIVKKYRGVDEIEDLLQESYFGLHEAVQHYDSTMKVPFVNYAAFWIRQTVGRYIKGNGCVRIPEHAQNLQRKIKKMELQWLSQFGRKPTEWESCRYLGIDLESLKQARKDAKMSQIGSLDVPVGEDGDATLYELVPGRNDMDEVLEQVQQEQLQTVIWSVVDSLPDKQPEVLRMRYQEHKTLQAVGDSMGQTRNQVRQIENKALRNLRYSNHVKMLLPFLDEEIRSRGMCGNGVGSFSQTWTSSTEKAALWLSER